MFSALCTHWLYLPVMESKQHDGFRASKLGQIVLQKVIGCLLKGFLLSRLWHRWQVDIPTHSFDWYHMYICDNQNVSKYFDWYTYFWLVGPADNVFCVRAHYIIFLCSLTAVLLSWRKQLTERKVNFCSKHFSKLSMNNSFTIVLCRFATSTFSPVN